MSVPGRRLPVVFLRNGWNPERKIHLQVVRQNVYVRLVHRAQVPKADALRIFGFQAGSLKKCVQVIQAVPVESVRRLKVWPRMKDLTQVDDGVPSNGKSELRLP